jgi:ppGpp synthetase/RelA/SpoT-type nucleotidyltranferase
MDIFKYVDGVVEYYEKIAYKYKDLAQELKQMLEAIVVANSEYTLAVSSRVKEADSVREKLIRNSYYRLHTSKEEIIANVQDIIGLRIECKFTEDEAYVYSLIEKLFSKTDDQIYFYHEKYPKMRLKMTDKQPTKQKNGFDIYKLDGRFEDKEGDKDVRINFEIQIKSMVNMFWGEIEHKIIYKNPSYFMVEQQVIESMMSIKENLNLVDHQLHKLYKRYKREDNSKLSYRKENIESILSKLIHDTFARKMRNELGFIVQFKETCDSIVEYIFVANNAAQMEDYGRVMMDTFYITGNVTRQELSFRAPLTLEGEMKMDDPFIDTVGVAIQKLMNVDFNWHLYFVILFELERGKNVDTLETYLRYLKGRLTANAGMNRLEEVFPQEAAKKIRADLMNEMGYVFRRHADITLLYKEGIKELARALKKTVGNIAKDKPDWNKEKSIYFLYLNNCVNLD